LIWSWDETVTVTEIVILIVSLSLKPNARILGMRLAFEHV